MTDGYCICVVGIDGRWSWRVKNQNGVTIMRGKKTKSSAEAARRKAERMIGRG